MKQDSSLLPTKDLIKFLLEQKYPGHTHQILRLSQTKGRQILSSRGGSSYRDNLPSANNLRNKEGFLKKVKAYEEELRAKPYEKLSELYNQEKEKQRQQLEKKRDLEEEQRFFNKKSSNADFVHWSKAAYWSLDEAIALVLGKAPENVKWDYVREHRRVSPFAGQYDQLRDLVLRAKTTTLLSDPVHPRVFLAWAKKMEVEIPSELLDLVTRYGAKISDWKAKYIEINEQYKTLTASYEKLVREKKDRTDNIDKKNILDRCQYWSKLKKLAKQAIRDYPSWRNRVGHVKKSGNLQEWLTKTIGANTRETEMLKKVLSGVYEDLK